MVAWKQCFSNMTISDVLMCSWSYHGTDDHCRNVSECCRQV